MGPVELSYRSELPVPVPEVLAWHGRPGAFERLTPPWMDVRMTASHGSISPGDWKRLRLGVGPLGIDWTVTHLAPAPRTGWIGFLDEQVSGPFSAWRHEHRFEDGGDGGSVLEDVLTYRLPLGSLGHAVAGRSVYGQMDAVFGFRHRRTQHDLWRHAGYAGAPLGIVVSGASGLVGRQLVAFLRAGGHTVYRLVRRKPAGDDEIFWDPGNGQIDAAAMEGMDAVIHLAGASIAGGRWSGARKQAMLASRVDGTTLLAETLARLQTPPGVLVSASATGYYGNRGDELLPESAGSSAGFLAGVCRAWEDATQSASSAGIRVVTPRFGVVLAGDGGLLARVGKLFRFGLGGRLGHGEQFFSWIALDDLLGVLHRAVVDPSLRGPINAVAPNPVTNREFTATLGRVLGRPAIAPAPATALRVAFGDLADELLLASQRVVPARLLADRFSFAYPTLESALRHELGRSDGTSLDLGEISPVHDIIIPSATLLARCRDAA